MLEVTERLWDTCGMKDFFTFPWNLQFGMCQIGDTRGMMSQKGDAP